MAAAAAKWLEFRTDLRMVAPLPFAFVATTMPPDRGFGKAGECRWFRPSASTARRIGVTPERIAAV
ncbi:hypothetical protein [Pseudopontixanthobacter vadosimaris]|uniref:hypothetical protein n=1 Tax=Pseudopontixanthobacter vadosimaris TaxID=2726450 RepID=UPI001473C14E|nr:hypothetical protein [Pseudopontixanthobacter vadosimaris]